MDFSNQPPGLFDSPLQHVLMRGEAGALLEDAGKMKRAQVHRIRELVEAQFLRRVRLDIFQLRGELSVAKPAGRRGSALRNIAISLHDMSGEGQGQILSV